MKKIVLTENNIKLVVGMLKKFFYNPNNGFIVYSNFDCGIKNIKPIYSPTLYDTVDNIVIRDIGQGPFIRLSYQKNVSISIYRIGDTFYFKGSEFIIKSKCNGSIFKFNYSYKKFVMKKLTEDDISNINSRRRYDFQQYMNEAFSDFYIWIV